MNKWKKFEAVKKSWRHFSCLRDLQKTKPQWISENSSWRIYKSLKETIDWFIWKQIFYEKFKINSILIINKQICSKNICVQIFQINLL